MLGLLSLSTRTFRATVRSIDSLLEVIRKKKNEGDEFAIGRTEEEGKFFHSTKVCCAYFPIACFHLLFRRLELF